MTEPADPRPSETDLPRDDAVGERTDRDVSCGRRAALGKLAYASPVLAGLLFSQSAVNAQTIGPPPRPPGG